MGKENSKNKNNLVFNIVIIALCVLLVAVSAAAVYLYVNNRNVTEHSGSVENELSAAQEEIASYEAALAQKDEEVQSYSRAYDEQSSVYESEKESLNEKISDLNKQISIKHQREAEEAAAAAAAIAATAAAPAAEVPAGETPAAAPAPTPAPAPAQPSGSGKVIYLTFDDGPSANTPRILEILDRYGVKATFFVKNSGYNGYMKDIVNHGHTIALHTYSHTYSTVYSSDEAFYTDLQQISDVVYNNTGVRSNIMRFPGGSSNTVSRKYSSGIMSRVTKGVQERGYQYYDWNCDSRDASGNNVSVETIVSSCKKVPKSNTVIVLMHDTNAKGTTVAALPQVIEYYRSCGYSFAAITSSTPPVHQKVNN